MSDEAKKAFIESPNFPIVEVNQAAAREKGPGRPPHWEMVFWWTRKPLIGARAFILASLLPEDTDKHSFLAWLPITRQGTPHRFNPRLPDRVKERLRRARLLDPFAGFGSIPLEAMRLGVGEVVAVELLPTAYIFLKAILEYPKWAAENKLERKLLEDLERWGNWITEKLREDPDIKELYDPDTAVYIGSWEVKCPVCGKYTPLVGNWWLARVKGKTYAYMKPRKEGDKIKIDIIEGRRTGAPEPNVKGRPAQAKCLHCGSTITYLDPETGRTYRSKSEAPQPVRQRLEFLPKHAIREWNKRLEEYLEGQITLEELKQSPARPVILVKARINKGELEFQPATEEDNQKLWRALEKLRQIWGDPDIPIEPVPNYERRQLMVCTSTGACKWYQLFNPRQLLTLVKLVKLIRETGKKVEEEKIKGGCDPDKSKKYSEIITTYLAISLTKQVDYNSLVTAWNAASWSSTSSHAAHTLSFRGIATSWNFVDNSFINDRMGFSSFVNSVKRGLEYLVHGINYNDIINNNLKIMLDDSTVLNDLEESSFDVIFTDPPYRDDVPYTELSDFYYVWLKRALSDDGLAPRFHGEALGYNTQWEVFAPSEISFNQGRMKYFGVDEAGDYYVRLLGQAFRRMSELVKDDGLIVTYFAHSSPEAWIELIEAGWRRAGLRVTRAWSTSTERQQRVTARGKAALESSIVVVWRKRRGNGLRSGEYSVVVDEAFEAAREALESAKASRLTSADIFLSTMIGALSVFTSYDRVVRFGRELSSRDVVKESYAITTRVLAGAGAGISSPEALFYLAAKAVYRRYALPRGQIRMGAEPITLSSQDVIVLSYGFLGEDEAGYRLFSNARIIKPVDTSGPNVSKPKAFTLLEPLEESLEAVKSLLGRRGVNPLKLAATGRRFNSIDALHLLEYFAKQGRGEFEAVYRELYSRYPREVREAVEVARVLSGLAGDPERPLAGLVLKYLGGG